MQVRTVLVMEAKRCPARALRGLALAAVLLVAPAAGAQQAPDLDTPYVPTPQVVVDRMLDMAQVGKGDMVIDLGSGDGRLVISAATEHGAHGFGVELDPRLVERSNRAAAQAGVADRVKFIQKDLFETDISAADVLTLYLLPDVNLKLRPRILAQLRPGTRVVSHDWDMREWRPDAQVTVPAPNKSVGLRKESKIMLWLVPARVEGAWTLHVRRGSKEQQLPLALTQQFQFVSGHVGATGAALADGRLHGEELHVSLPAGVLDRGAVELVGRVAGDHMQGKVQRAGRTIASWTAQRKP